MTKLIKNSIQCNKCKDIIVSVHRHDFRWCSCGAIFIDGGLDYSRRGGEPGDMTDLCEYEEPEEDSE
jgi:hypothetical protein